MINKWILDNFKSINEEKKLPFRPLTIFTGANSSGKSTILQSILLVTQTLQDSIPSRSIVLNGWFKKFGSYDDIVHRRDFGKDIKIGFELSGDYNVISRHSFGLWDDELRSVDCSFTVASNNVKEDLLPYLKELKLETTDEKDKKTSLKLTKIKEPSKEVQKILANINDAPSADELEYKVEADFDNLRRFYDRTRLQKKYIGAGMSHFLPEYLLHYYNQSDRLKENLFNCVMTRHNYYTEIFDSIDAILENELSAKGKDIAEDVNRNVRRKTKAYTHLYERISEHFTFDLLLRLFEAGKVDDMQKITYVNELQEILSKLPVTYCIDRIPMYYQPGVEYVKSFFTDHIKYLGPLREEPRALYPLESSGSASDLGLKGENTAAVLQNNKDKVISYIDPVCFENDIDGEMPITEGTLTEAIHKWLVYLGVASNIGTNDKGKFGHELKITNEIKGMEQDLTHVGVGVSQVLPILVLSFLSGKGDVIILEQPELHLHPKVQTRLADFFVSMNALEKQCVLETHSEYLINRLRLLVAKSDSTRIADDTMIYFVEKDKTNGYSKYREITINPYGKIDHWPDGFFDEGEDLASQIVRASYEKKKREKLKAEKK